MAGSMENQESLHGRLRILRATSGDIERIAPLFDQYRRFYDQPSDLEAARSFLADRLSRDESVLFYASVEGTVVGFVQMYPSFSSVSLRRLWILNDLFVSPDSRGQSVGRRLLEAAADFARQTKARGLTLKTAHDNLPAQRLYESLGWRRDSRFCSYNLVV